MKFLSRALIPLLFGTQATVLGTFNDTLTEQSEIGLFLTGEQIIGEEDIGDAKYVLHDGSILNNTVRYNGSCEHQSECIIVVVREVQRRCGSGSCEYLVCYSSKVGDRAANAWLHAYNTLGMDGDQAATYAVNQCLQHAELGVDYACNTNEPSPDEDTGGCLNTPNSKGKGLWDENPTNPEVTDEVGVGTFATGTQTRFTDFCQTVAPGHTVNFIMHSHHSLDWNGDDPQPIVGCSGTAEKVVSGEWDKWGSSFCAPSSISKKTFFPASDGSSGGTCSDEPEGMECVWSYTAPNNCLFEENHPTCHLSQATVDTVTSLCPGHSVVEYYEHPDNPNEAPPRIPIHDIAHNGDGTVSFQIYNPYGNYNEPIEYDGVSECDNACDLLNGEGGANDYHDFYVVYDQANEIGNEVCEKELALGKCPTDNMYTAKCRSDGVSVVTVFASGMNATSAAAGQITNGVGTEVFACCPTNYDPNFQADSTVAWTFLIHCNCPGDVLDRRDLKEDISAKFQRGELFSENQKKLHKLL